MSSKTGKVGNLKETLFAEGPQKRQHKPSPELWSYLGDWSGICSLFFCRETQNSFCQKQSVWGSSSLPRVSLLLQSFTSGSSSYPNSHGKMLRESIPFHPSPPPPLFNRSLEMFHTIHHTSPVKPPFQTKLDSCNSPRKGVIE